MSVALKLPTIHEMHDKDEDSAVAFPGTSETPRGREAQSISKSEIACTIARMRIHGSRVQLVRWYHTGASLANHQTLGAVLAGVHTSATASGTRYRNVRRTASRSRPSLGRSITERNNINCWVGMGGSSRIMIWRRIEDAPKTR